MPLAAGALEMHGKADTRPRPVLVVLGVAPRRALGKQPVVLHYSYPALGSSPDDWAVGAGVDKDSRDHTAGIAVAENVVLAPHWMGPNL